MLNDFSNLINLIKYKKNILIYGDLVIDKYINIKSNRLSSECSIPVFEKENSHSFIGCSGNVARIINEFNVNTFLISAISYNNKKFIKDICFTENINIEYSIFIDNLNQNKIRYLNQNQQYFRIDECNEIDFDKNQNIIETNIKMFFRK